MNNQNICPCCPKGCNLSAPRCERGEYYAQTGVIPPELHGDRAPHGKRLQFDNPDQQMVMKHLHHAVRAADNGGFTQAMATDMFACLTPDETARLAALLEKLSVHWMSIAPEKPQRGRAHSSGEDPHRKRISGHGRDEEYHTHHGRHGH